MLNIKIESFNWDTIINDTCSVDQACLNFTEYFLKRCKECIPRQKVLIRQNDRPWFNSELRYNIRLRDRLRKRYFKTRRDAHRILYKQQRNKVNNMKKYAKQTFIDKVDDFLLNQESGDSNKNFLASYGALYGKKGDINYNTTIAKERCYLCIHRV